jgi:nucleotide-binding universal stress UspA family protein
MIETPSAIKVVLVPIDASPHSLAALEMGIRVAARLHAELRAMYVEDVDLLRAAELPFVRVIGSFGQAFPVTPDLVEKQLRRRADIARNAVETASARANVTCSFSVVRGLVSREITRAASSAEIVTVGRSGWSPPGRRDLGSVVRALLETRTTSVLMVERSGPYAPVAVLYDSSSAAERALTLALTLDGNQDHPLHILITDGSPELRSTLKERISRAGSTARFEPVGETWPAILEGLQRSSARTLLLPVTVLSTDTRASTSDLGTLNRSIFVVR